MRATAELLALGHDHCHFQKFSVRTCGFSIESCRFRKMSTILTPTKSDQSVGDVLQRIIASIQRLNLPQDVKIGKVIGLGGFADVYEGELFNVDGIAGKKVAVKRFRILMEKEKKFANVRLFPFCASNNMC